MCNSKYTLSLDSVVFKLFENFLFIAAAFHILIFGKLAFSFFHFNAFNFSTTRNSIKFDVNEGGREGNLLAGVLEIN